MKKILIAVPSMNTVPVEFAQSLACLNRCEAVAIQFNVGSLIYESRNKLALDAIKGGYDYVMWFDSDMQFASDTLEKMVKHMEQYDLVTGLYFRRAAPFSPVLFSKLEFDDKGNCDHANYDDYPEEMFKVAGAGFGCVMMKTSVLLDVFATFGNAFAPIGNTGEDVAFCHRANLCGYQMYCDPSIKLGHVGYHVINEDFFRAYR